MREMINMVLILSVLTAFSGGLLAIVKSTTQDRIEAQILKFQKAPAIGQIFTDVDNDPLAERFTIKSEDMELQIFPGKLSNGSNAIAFETKGGGYGGQIGLMVGINLDTDEILDVRVTTHAETPGIGSRAKDDTDFVSQFAGLKLDTNFAIKSENGVIDAMSGATITSRGVSAAAIQAQEVYKKLKPEIIRKIQ